ncbi:serine O-acetyltransferase [Eisenbergiella sp.]
MEVTKLLTIYRRSNNHFVKSCARKLAKYLGCVIGDGVQLGNNVQFVHNSIGTVINSGAIIEDNVQIYQNVTIGRADVKSTGSTSWLIKKGSILCAGAKILCRPGQKIVIGENSIIGANAVLLNSVPRNEVWGGVPAKKIGDVK